MITLSIMIRKLGCENLNQVSRALLVQFMDALDGRGGVGMDFSWVFEAVETAIADCDAGAPRRYDITTLVVRRA